MESKKGKPVAFSEQDKDVQEAAIELVRTVRSFPNRRLKRAFLAQEGITLDQYRVIEEGVLIYGRERFESSQACARINARAAAGVGIQADRE